jgi:hypothetical protein
MSEKDNSVPSLSLEIERARVKCSLVIRACARGIVRARLRNGSAASSCEASR